MDGRANRGVRGASVSGRLSRPVHFPSDLSGLEASERTALRVAGRVIDARDGSVTLADAFALVIAHGAALFELAVGDLVVVCGNWDGKVLGVSSL